MLIDLFAAAGDDSLARLADPANTEAVVTRAAAVALLDMRTHWDESHSVSRATLKRFSIVEPRFDELALLLAVDVVGQSQPEDSPHDFARDGDGVDENDNRSQIEPSITQMLEAPLRVLVGNNYIRLPRTS